MFPRFFHARRFTCRTVFVVACLMPTTAMVVYGAWHAAPIHRAAFCNALADTLAVQVTVDNVDYPRPGVTRIQGLELADPESKQLLLRVPVFEVRDSGDRYVLHAATATLNTVGAHRLYKELHRRLAGDDDVAWQVDIGELMLQHHERRRATVELSARGSMGASGPAVDVKFRLTGDTGEKANEIKLLRNRQVNPAVTTFMLQTGDTPLPCSLLGQFAPEWDTLGNRATFAGRFWTMDASDGRRGELSGELNRVDLHQLVTQHYGHSLTGMSRLRIERAFMRRGRLQSVEATIDAGPGNISQHLLHAASRELQMPLVAGNRTRKDIAIAYQRLTAHVVVDGHGMRIRGLRPTPTDRNLLPRQAVGVILAGRNGQILVEPRYRLPVTAVLRTLATGDGDGALVHGPVGDLAKWLPQRLASSTPEPSTAQPQRR